jgi:hypothetical protein
MNIFIVENASHIDKILKLLGSQSFPGLVNSIKIAANTVQKDWINEIKNSKIKEGWKKEYINAIRINYEDDLNVEIYADEDNKFVNFAEEGIKRFDMKPGLINGPHSRQGKNGRYNIVFFRKGVPGTQHIQNMAQTTYKKIQKLSKEDIIKRYKTMGIGNIIQMKTKKVKARSKTKTSGFDIQKIGSRNHTQYGNFRVVTQRSVGWIYPGIQGIKVFSIVSRKIQSKVKKILQDGLTLDLKSGLEYMEKA